MSESADENSTGGAEFNEPRESESATALNAKSIVDINDQNELDYEEDEETHNQKKQNETDANKAAQHHNDSDGELKSDNEVSHRRREDGEENSSSDEDDEEGKGRRGNRKSRETEGEKEKPTLSEEEGEINDGEKVKKPFVPRVLCKFFQRGKCSWGRSCKFLHPGVNDTGNYTFLEVEDPNAKVYQRNNNNNSGRSRENQEGRDLDNIEQQQQQSGGAPQNESAWERALRQAKEMKEKAKQRKQADKDEFMDKKMNLSLKEFENEKENDERYLNIENVTNADEDLEDEEVRQYVKSGGRLNRSMGDSGVY